MSFDDLARTLATPMPRRRALRTIGAALAVGAFPALRPGRAAGHAAGSTAGCPITCTGEEQKCCVKLAGKDRYNAVGCYDPKFQKCCVGSNQDPKKPENATWRCSKCAPCGTFKKPCSGRGALEVCGEKCCAQGEYCASSRRSLCCRKDEEACEDKCCGPKQQCIDGQCRCPAGRAVCGRECCAKNKVCSKAVEYRTGKATYACCTTGKVNCGDRKCCNPDNCCGGKCCSKDEYCCGGQTCCKKAAVCASALGGKKGKKVCCPSTRVAKTKGKRVCCPIGTRAFGDICCPGAFPDCCPEDLVCLGNAICVRGVCQPVG